MKFKTITILFILIVISYGVLNSEFMLGANDLIYIDIMPNYFIESSPLYGGDQRVDPDGNIHLKLIGDINITGMTPSMLSSVLEEEYMNYLIEPEVVIKIIAVSNSRVIIAGEVRNPGVYILERNISVVEAIQMAGGSTDDALLYDVKVLRGGIDNPEVFSCDVDEIMKEGKLDTNIYLQSGDIIYVPETLISRYNELLDNVTPTVNAIVGGGRIIDTFTGQ